MTQEVKDNKLQMTQPFKILTDIWGVITSWNFRNELINYANNHLSKYLTENWKQNFICDFVNRLREQTLTDRKTEITIDMPSVLTEDQNNSLEIVIKSIVDNIEWRKIHKFNSFDGHLEELYEQMWSDGYKNKLLFTHAFDDVIPALQQWTSEPLSIKMYTFASGSPEAQKLFLSSSKCGNISQYIMNGINSFHKYKYNPKKYEAVISSLLESKPNNILYLTDSIKKAKAAIQAGMRAVVILRPGNKKYSQQELKPFNKVSSIQDLVFLKF